MPVIAFDAVHEGVAHEDGLATDDAHDHHGRGDVSTPGRGWVWVRAAELTPAAIITALRAGDFYASTGVRLREVRMREENVLRVAIDEDPR